MQMKEVAVGQPSHPAVWGRIIGLSALVSIVLFFCPWLADAAAITDSVVFGDATSEAAHHLQEEHSQIVRGELNQTARVLLPTSTAWRGGTVSFNLAVDPQKPNYITVRYWGSEASPDRLILFCDGKQIGYQHLGDYDLIDFGGLSAPYPGRFVYSTTVLPASLTHGKHELSLQIRGTGPINRFGADFSHFQLPMKGSTRAVYAAYSHTDPLFTPERGEKQGVAPVDPPTRTTPGPEVIDHLKARVNAELDHLLQEDAPLNQLDLWLLARAYHVSWSTAYRNPKVVEAAVRGVDTLYAHYAADPTFVYSDPDIYNPAWTGVGFAGEAVSFLGEPLQPWLDKPLTGGMSRRAAWSAMLQTGRGYLLTHRPQYTNQTMITDLSMYRTNLGVLAIDAPHAMPLDKAVHYLYQAIGIEPWLGSDTPQGPSLKLGDHYFELTQKGLTRELGFVGYYGEVLDWATQFYDVTKNVDHADAPGDAKIRGQLLKMAQARSVFRYPMLDPEGHRAMLMEAVVGWRDDHYPAEVVYAERSAWEGSSIAAAAATLDPRQIGYVHQMLDDHQFDASVEDLVQQKGTRVTKTLLLIPDELDAIRKAPPNHTRLPMSDGEPDFIFSDEEDGVIAIRHGSERLYASLYWRARFGINHLARIHFINPTMDRLATVWEDAEFVDSGKRFMLPDWIAMGFGSGGPTYPDDFHSALAGISLPIAAWPDGEDAKPGEESLYAGRASFYTLRYGHYLIGMNMTSDRTYKLAVPHDAKIAVDLRSKQSVKQATSLSVAPQSTTVLWIND